MVHEGESRLYLKAAQIGSKGQFWHLWLSTGDDEWLKSKVVFQLKPSEQTQNGWHI